LSKKPVSYATGFFVELARLSQPGSPAGLPNPS